MNLAHSDLKKNREGFLVGDWHRECTNCHVVFKRTSKMPLCGSCNSKRVKNTCPKKKMLQRAKTRAKEKNLEFSITVSDFSLPSYCPILGIPLKLNSGRSGAFIDSYSLDRIDNDKGYIPGNVQVMSQLANSMKGAATKEQLILFANWVLETYK